MSLSFLFSSAAPGAWNCPPFFHHSPLVSRLRKVRPAPWRPKVSVLQCTHTLVLSVSRGLCTSPLLGGSVPRRLPFCLLPCINMCDLPCFIKFQLSMIPGLRIFVRQCIACIPKDHSTRHDPSELRVAQVTPLAPSTLARSLPSVAE